MRLVIAFALLGTVLAEENSWQPVIPESSVTYQTYHDSERSLDTRPQFKIVNRRPIQSPQYVSPNKVTLFNQKPSPSSDACSIYKVSMNQELFYQYMEYDKRIPDLKEFTLCMWKKFHNHSSDHPLFSYSVGDKPKEILAWISNTEEASYYSMAVHGQTFFRLNYPLKLNTWYHSCQSWNGKTGEWQVWVNGERVGRGFHNRLVGHVIKGGGIAVSGQDQSLLYNENPIEPVQKQSGFVGEITMLQLYHVALTAGKAHKDHKHHHVHHFKHDGTPLETSTEPVTEPPPPQATPLGNGNFLIGGQLQRAQQLNLAGSQQMIPVQLPNGLQLQQEYVNGQLGNRLISEQLLNSVQPASIPLSVTSQPHLSLVSPAGQNQGFSRQPFGQTKGTTVVLSSSLLNPANVKYVDDSIQHNLFKRNSKRDKRDNPEKELKRELAAGKKDKRGLVALSDGSIVDEALLSPDPLLDSDREEEISFQQSLLSGLAGFVGNRPVQILQKETVSSISDAHLQEEVADTWVNIIDPITVDEREPAEAEVKAVMQICSGCVNEPFKKALIISWNTTPKKLYSGAHYYKGLPICRAF